MTNILIKRSVYFLQTRTLASAVTTKRTATTAASPSSFTVRFLRKTCGLPLDTALSTSKTIQLEDKESKKYGAVLSFLRSHGFSETHIASLIKKRPKTLKSSVDNTIKPKIDFLLKNGISDSFLPDLIAFNPSILNRSLNSHLKPSFDFLKCFLKTDGEIIEALKSTSWLLSHDLKRRMQPNANVLISEGVPISNITKLIISNPRAILLKVEKMVAAVEHIKRLGFKQSTPMFIRALRVMLGLSNSTWKRKVNLFKSLGWSEEDIISAFKREPALMSCSEEKIRHAIDFFWNTMKVKQAVLISNPKLLLYEPGRNCRRYNVMKALESKKLIGKDVKIVWFLIQPESRFLKYYVTKHLDQIPGLMEMYCATNSTTSQ